MKAVIHHIIHSSFKIPSRTLDQKNTNLSADSSSSNQAAHHLTLATKERDDADHECLLPFGQTAPSARLIARESRRISEVGGRRRLQVLTTLRANSAAGCLSPPASGCWR